MPGAMNSATPDLPYFLKALKSRDVEPCIELLADLLKRRQIRTPRLCALATTHLLRRVLADFRGANADELLLRIRSVGRRLIAATPREMVVGNMVRRVLALIREVAEGAILGSDRSVSDEGLDGDSERDGDSEAEKQESRNHSPVRHRPNLSSGISTFSPLKHGATEPASMVPPKAEGELPGTYTPLPIRPSLQTALTQVSTIAPTAQQMFGLFTQPEIDDDPSGVDSPALQSVKSSGRPENFTEVPLKDIKAEVLESVREILDELESVDQEIALYALDHIHADEIILTYTASLTVQNFLLTAARKRKFTVIHVEGYPNESASTVTTIFGGRPQEFNEELELADEPFKPLTAAGITVIMIPDAAVFALMSRVNKVILATHTVLANGGLVAAAGAGNIVKAAKVHQTPVVVLSGVYKLSPIYPFDNDELIEWGDAGVVERYSDQEIVQKLKVFNPLYDYITPDLIDLYITNLGGHAPSYLYKIVMDHYDIKDVNLED